MKEAHKGMAITAKEFDAIAAVLAKALKDNGVAQADIDAVLGAVAKTKDDIVEKKE
jgi:truncated hemoglobin YjbI